MFDFDAGKLLIIGVVALIVIGPKDLPRVLRQVGQAVGRLRRMASEFQGQFMDAMKEADLQDIRDEVSKLRSHTDLSTHFDPARDIQRDLTQAVTPSPSAHAEPQPVSAYALPAAEEHQPIETGEAVTPVDVAPEVDWAADHHETPEVGVPPHPGEKRKIVLRKRRPSQPDHDPRLANARFRNVKPRRREADQ